MVDNFSPQMPPAQNILHHRDHHFGQKTLLGDFVQPAAADAREIAAKRQSGTIAAEFEYREAIKLRRQKNGISSCRVFAIRQE